MVLGCCQEGEQFGDRDSAAVRLLYVKRRSRATTRQSIPSLSTDYASSVAVMMKSLNLKKTLVCSYQHLYLRKSKRCLAHS
jgi:hypothetical protein